MRTETRGAWLLLCATMLAGATAANASTVSRYVVRSDTGAEKALSVVNRLLKQGVPVYQASSDFAVGHVGIHAGDFLVSIPKTPRTMLDDVYRAYAMDLGRRYGVPLHPLGEWGSAVGRPLRPTSVGVYFGQGTSAGALWHIRPAEAAGFDMDILLETDLAANSFGASNVITFPSGGFYSGYIGATGNEAVRQFVAAGHGFFGTCGGSVYGMDLNLIDATLDLQDGWPAAADLRGPLLLSNEASSHPTMVGIGPTWTPNYWTGQNFVSVGANVTVLAKYLATTPYVEPYDPALSRAYGYYPNTEIINRFWGRPAVITAPYAGGKVVLSGVHPEVEHDTQRFYLNTLTYLTAEEPQAIDSIAIAAPTGERGPVDGMGTRWLPAEARIMAKISRFRELVDIARAPMVGLEVENEKIADAVGEFLVAFLDDELVRSVKLIRDVERMGRLYRELSVLRVALQAQRAHPSSPFHQMVLNRVDGARAQLAAAMADLDGVDGLFAACESVGARMVQHATDLKRLLVQRGQEGESPAFYAGVIQLYQAENASLHSVKLETEYFILKSSFKVERAMDEARFTQVLAATLFGHSFNRGETDCETD
jgi:hypothetical protein